MRFIMDNISILHLSDVHISNNNINEIKRLYKILIKDINDLCKKNNTIVKFICITGDLINSGSLHNEEYNLFLDNIILPLCNDFNITEDNIFMVPGNHDVNINEINKYEDDGLLANLIETYKLENYITCNKVDKRLLDYFEFVDSINTTSVFSDSFSRCFIKEINGFTFGFACLNSAWRSCGKGAVERGLMLLGQKQLLNAYESISNTDIKICLMHHPIDWLKEFDQFDIERSISNFNIVLNGHVHSNFTKATVSYSGKTLFNTCGKFYPTGDIYNGYSLININPYTQKGSIYLRQYFNYPRNCFDESIQLAPNGQYNFDLHNRDENSVLAYEIITGFRKNFNKYADEMFITNFVDKYHDQNFDKLFIKPLLYKDSYYEKEVLLEGEDYLNKTTKSREIYNIEDINFINNNIVIYGRKEVGKTTLINYFVKEIINNFSKYNKIPIIVDCAKKIYGKNAILNSIDLFIREYSSASLNYSIDTIKNMLEMGLFYIVFENIESMDDKLKETINNFINNHTNNRYIFTQRDDVNNFGGILEKDFPFNCDCISYYLHPFQKNQIRKMVKNITGSDENSNLIDKTVLCFRNTNLPQNPFVVSLVVYLCDIDDEFVPVNEAVVMENFLETLMEKNSSDSAKSSNFDYRIKEDFLIYLSYNMLNKNEYEFTQNEFTELLYKYHMLKGFDISDSKFDNFFFEKGILIKYSNHIAFRYSCMIEYFLAQKAQKSEEFLNYILKEENYLNYIQEFSYYTGLNRENYKVANVIGERLEKILNLYQINDDANSIKYNFSVNPENMHSFLGNKIPQELADELTDIEDHSENMHINKLPNIDIYSKENQSRLMAKNIFLYGKIIKNSELFSFDEKQKMYSLYINGLCKLLYITKESIIKDIINISVADDELKNVKDICTDIVKISVPIMIQNVAMDSVGTAKLKKVIMSNIDKSNNYNSFEMFLNVFLACDLRIKGSINNMENFIKKTTSKDLLTISFFKILYYYHYRYFAKNYDNRLENILATINQKLFNHGKNLSKSVLISNLKESRPKKLKE